VYTYNIWKLLLRLLRSDILKNIYLKVTAAVFFILSITTVGCSNEPLAKNSTDTHLIENKSINEVGSTSDAKKYESEIFENNDAKNSSKSSDSSNKVDKSKNKKPAKKIKEIQGLVELKELDHSFVFELRYASKNNFTGEKIYKAEVCALRKDTAQKLIKANEEFKKKGYRIKIWDAYRPHSVQKMFWNKVKGTSESKYFADPNKKGSRHSYGAAVDITLVDSKGKELKMPSEFDEFNFKASRNNGNMNKEAKENMEYMTRIMKKNGFLTINSEWWHFEDTDWKKYKLLDLKLEEFLN
jgi:zinc D-Ala-D-Ala dipeptidase